MDFYFNLAYHESRGKQPLPSCCAVPGVQSPEMPMLRSHCGEPLISYGSRRVDFFAVSSSSFQNKAKVFSKTSRDKYRSSRLSLRLEHQVSLLQRSLLIALVLSELDRTSLVYLISTISSFKFQPSSIPLNSSHNAVRSAVPSLPGPSAKGSSPADSQINDEPGVIMNLIGISAGLSANPIDVLLRSNNNNRSPSLPSMTFGILRTLASSGIIWVRG